MCWVLGIDYVQRRYHMTRSGCVCWISNDICLTEVSWLVVDGPCDMGTGPPDEVWEMLALPPTETVIVALVTAAALEFAKCAITVIMLVF